MSKYLVIIFLLFSVEAIGQKMVIRDAATLKGIPDVMVFSQNNSEISNLSGTVKLSSFQVGDSILFQHPSYNSVKYLIASIESDIEIKLIEKSIKLDEIVVSVSRWAESSAEFPNKVVGITASDIEFSNPQTTADALMQTGEVYVQKSQLGGGSPMIRGFAANRILLTVDGIRLNNAIYRSGNLQNIISVDANSLEGTEVIFGPGSVQYGSDALGGVINMMTLRTHVSQQEPLLKGNALVRYSSSNNERTGHFDINYAGKKFGAVSSLSYSRFDDQRMGARGPEEYLRPEYVSTVNGADMVLPNDDPQKQVFSGFGQFSFIQKLKFKLTDNLITEAGVYYSNTNNIPRYDRLIQYKNDTLRYSNWYYGPQQWIMGKVDLLYSKKNALFDVAKAQFAYQQAKESRHDRDFGSDIRRNRFEGVDVFTINLDFTKPVSENHHFYYGFNAGFNKVSSTAHLTDLDTGNEQPSATRYPHGSTYNNYAVYLNYEYKPSSRLNVMAGIRYSIFNLDATFDTSFYPFPFTSANLNPSAPSGSLGMVYNPGDGTIVQANISTAFRAPNIDDIGKVFDSEPGRVVVPNPALEPEYAYNLDLGVTQSFGDAIRVDITGFYTYLDNAMVRRDFTFNGEDSILYDGEMSKVQALTNTGGAYLFGFNGKLFIDFTENWSLTASLNYTYGRDDDNYPLRHISPTFGSTHLYYKRNRIKFDLFVDYSEGFRYSQLAPEEQAKPDIYAIDKDGLPYSPSWVTLNFKTAIQLIEFLQLNAGLENILNARYRTYSSGIVAPGINVIVGLRANF